MLNLLLYSYMFIIGLVFGSFFNVVGIRTADGRSIVRPRSHCPRCNHYLTASELVPVVSYLLQNGCCKNCGSPISIRYPLFELLTACLFTISPMVAGWSKDLLVVLLLVSLVVIVTVSDTYKMLIPNRVLLFFFPVMVIVRLFIPTTPWWDAYARALLGFALLLLIAVASKGGMGGGDIKLFAVLGLFLGIKGTVLTLVLAAILGLLYALVLLAAKKLNRKEPIPFGPFIGAAALISYVYSESIWASYLNLLT